MPLDRTERAHLCAAVNLVDLMAGDGIDARRTGQTYIASLRREDKTPSCHIYPPGVGRRGGDGWTFYDYGTGAGGDVLGYLVDVRGLDFAAAVDELRNMAGKPAPLAYKAAKGREGVKVTPPRPAPYSPPEWQLDAAAAFLLELVDVYPEAVAGGDAYLVGRGVMPDGMPPLAYSMPEKVMPELRRRLAEGPDTEHLLAAGLLKEDGRLQWDTWAGDVVLLVHHDQDGIPAALIARRTDYKAGDTCGKYLQQTFSKGAARVPFNLLALYRPPGLQWKPAPARAGELLLVEGPLDALGAACLGWPALALSMRPRARGYTDHEGAAPRMLEPHLAALRDLDKVLVVPDADKGDKGAEGEALAAALVGWLRAAGCRADVATVPELCPTAPAECKDLADVAATKGTP